MYVGGKLSDILLCSKIKEDYLVSKEIAAKVLRETAEILKEMIKRVKNTKLES